MERQPNDLDVFEMNRAEVNVLLALLSKQPYSEVSEVIKILSNRAPARVLATEAEIAALKASEEAAAQGAKEVNPEAAADMAEASAPSEEEMGTEQ